MRLAIHLACFDNAHRVIAGQRVQRLHHPVGIEFVGNVQMRHLAGGMDAGICPAGALYQNVAAGQFGRRLFQHLLDRQAGDLALPADKGGAVIFDGDEDAAGHSPPSGVAVIRLPCRTGVPFRKSRAGIARPPAGCSISRMISPSPAAMRIPPSASRPR